MSGVEEKKSKSRYLPVKPSGATATLQDEERACVTFAVTPSSESVNKVPVVQQEQTNSSAGEEPDPGYAAFVSDGYVSLTGSEGRVAVNVLTDTGALNSFIADSACSCIAGYSSFPGRRFWSFPESLLWYIPPLG